MLLDTPQVSGHAFSMLECHVCRTGIGDSTHNTPIDYQNKQADTSWDVHSIKRISQDKDILKLQHVDIRCIEDLKKIDHLLPMHQLALNVRLFSSKDCEKIISSLKQLDVRNVVFCELVLPEYALTVSDIDWLSDMKNLQYLALQTKSSKNHESSTLFDNLRGFANLTHFHYVFSENEKEVNSFLCGISNHPSLSWISISGITFPESGEWEFPKKLQKLFIGGSKLSNSALAKINQTSAL
ncbi:MAG: hypothetical protein ACRCUY_12405 [Thermoguttaceae bacterium]